MSAFASWLIRQITTWGIKICNVFIDFFQAAFDGFFDFIITLLQYWPEGTPTPVAGPAPSGNITETLLICVNWLFPMSFFLTTLLWLGTAMFAYILIAPLLRWAKILT